MKKKPQTGFVTTEAIDVNMKEVLYTRGRVRLGFFCAKPDEEF